MLCTKKYAKLIKLQTSVKMAAKIKWNLTTCKQKKHPADINRMQQNL